jgi:hypothetical protein
MVRLFVETTTGPLDANGQAFSQDGPKAIKPGTYLEKKD